MSTDLPSGPKPGPRDTAFFEDPMIDHLLRAVVTLTQELSVTRDRLRSLEAMMADAGQLDRAALDHRMVPAEEERQRVAARGRLVSDVLGPMVNRLADTTRKQ
jgi:hypothetical protein